MATPSEIWQNIMSGVLAICAVIAIGVMVSRRATVGASSASSISGPPVMVDDWGPLVAAGHRIGPSNAVVTILEFGDFECPVCGSYQQTTLAPFLLENATTAALVYRHWPLSYHRFAMPAARASECAARQGAFPAYHHELYAHQDRGQCR
jgi:protein-disulfide isomerase